MKQIAFSPRYGLVRLDAGQFDEIEAMDVLEHAPDLTAFMTRGHELRARGLAEEEIFRTPRAVDDMQVVLVKRMVTQPEREAALAWQRGARHGPPAPEAEPANVQKAGLSQSLSANPQ